MKGCILAKYSQGSLSGDEQKENGGYKVECYLGGYQIFGHLFRGGGYLLGGSRYLGGVPKPRKL